KLSLSKPASTCPQCHQPIRWYQNIPVISWLVLRGKCGNCQNPISIRYPLVEILTAVCALIVVAVFGPTLQMLFGLILTYVLIALTFLDFATRLLHKRYTLPFADLRLEEDSSTHLALPGSANWSNHIGNLCLWVV